MGNQIFSPESNSLFQEPLKNIHISKPQVGAIVENFTQLETECEEDKKMANFLDQKFHEKKTASKKIMFGIIEQRQFRSNNFEVERQYSLLKLEESEKETMEKSITDFDKTDSLVFQTIQIQNEEIFSTLPLSITNESQMKQKIKTRSLFASYNSNYKKLDIKQSNFVKVRNHKFEYSYELLGKIGEGATGHVFKTRCRKTNQIRAVKILKTKILRKLNQTESLHAELNMLKNLDHPNIIKVFDVFSTEDFYYVVTQYCSGGTLQEYILKNSLIDQKLVKVIFKQLLGALTYLHSQSIVHRDIKMDNIVFDIHPTLCSSLNEIQIKIIDFGLSMKAKFRSINKDSPCMGTPLYMAPQVLKGKYSQKCDIWSCGVILHFLFFKEFPFQSLQKQEIYDKITSQTLDFSKPYWKNVSKEVKQVLVKMLDKNPLKRISASKALISEWLQETFDESRRTEKDLIYRKLRQYKKENNFITLIQSYLVFLKSSNEDQRKLINLFQKLDRNNNGVIDLQQLEELLGESSKKEDWHLKQLFIKIDKNNSGKIEISEFLSFFSDRTQLFTGQYLEEAFDFLDENKNGYIERSQLKKALNGCETEQYEVLWKDMDVDEDCRISKEEFFQYLLRMEEVKAQ